VRPDLELAYGEHRKQIFNYFRRCGLRGDEAEDLTQSVFATVLATLGRYEPSRGSLGGYIYGVARNHRRSFWKSMRRRTGRTEDAPRAARSADADTVAIVKEAVGALPDDQREALLLREFHGLSYDEIALVQGVPIGTVRSRISRAREALRESLHAPGERQP